MQALGQHIKITPQPIKEVTGISINIEAIQPAIVLEISPDIKNVPFKKGDTIQIIQSKVIQHSGEFFIMLDHVLLYEKIN